MVLMEAALRTELFGQECINRWNYVGSGTPAAVSMSFALANAMGLVRGLVSPFYPADGFMTRLSPLLGTDLIFRELIVKDIYSVTDFYTTPYVNGEVGTGGSTGSSPINAFGFRTNRVRSDIARGTKRLPGVTNEAVADGGTFVGGVTTLMNDVALLFGETLTYDDDGNTITFTPCVVSKEEYTTPSGKKAYRYYSTLSAQMAKVAQGIAWEPYTQVRGQASRQYGKGG